MPVSTPPSATLYSSQIYRGAQEAIFGFAREAAPLASGATALPSPPALQHGGYYDVAGVEQNENAQPIQTAGTYRPIQLTKGRREPTFRNNLRVGSLELMKYAVRSAEFGSDGGAHYKCLPLLAVGGGAVGDCDPDSDFGWVGRYAAIRELSFSFQDGAAQPLTSTIEFWPLALQTNAAATSAVTALVDGDIDDQETAMRLAGGNILMWHHTSWLMKDGDGNWIDYRNLIASLSVRITNNLERIGTRKDLGDNNDLSRTAIAIMPLEETVALELQLHDKLPDSFYKAAADSNLWGEIQIVAYDGTKNLTIRIAESRLARHGMNQVGPGALLRFTAGVASRVVKIEVSSGAASPPPSP